MERISAAFLLASSFICSIVSRASFAATCLACEINSSRKRAIASSRLSPAISASLFFCSAMIASNSFFLLSSSSSLLFNFLSCSARAFSFLSRESRRLSKLLKRSLYFFSSRRSSFWRSLISSSRSRFCLIHSSRASSRAAFLAFSASILAFFSNSSAILVDCEISLKAVLRFMKYIIRAMAKPPTTPMMSAIIGFIVIVISLFQSI